MPAMTKKEYDELCVLKKDLDQQIQINAKEIGYAASLGDLSENSEFEMAKAKRDLLHAQFRELSEAFVNLNIVYEEDLPTDMVTIGKQVTLRKINSTDTVSFTIRVYPKNINHISIKSPFGSTLLLKKIGDIVIYCGDPYEVSSIANET